MKIFYICVIEKNAGWGADYFINRGFIENGHTAITLDYRVNRHILGERFQQVKEDFDALFLQRGDYFPLELLRAVNRPRFFLASELVARNRDQDRLFECGLFEHIFVRSEECRRTLVAKGILAEDKVSVAMSGFDQAVFRKLEGVKKDIDILYMGGMTPRRAVWLERLGKLINITHARAFGDELNEYFNRAKIILNIHADDFVDTETRVFEAFGAGTFLLSEKLGSESPFEPGRDYAEVAGLEDMAEKARYYLAHEEERERIAASGHEAAWEAHTYTKRAEQIADVFARHTVGRGVGPAIDFEQARLYAKAHRADKIKGIVKNTLRENAPEPLVKIVRKLRDRNS